MKLLIYPLLLFLLSCSSDYSASSPTSCRIIGGEVQTDANGNYVGCIEPTTKE